MSDELREKVASLIEEIADHNFTSGGTVAAILDVFEQERAALVEALRLLSDIARHVVEGQYNDSVRPSLIAELAYRVEQADAALAGEKEPVHQWWRCRACGFTAGSPLKHTRLRESASNHEMCPGPFERIEP